MVAVGACDAAPASETTGSARGGVAEEAAGATVERLFAEWDRRWLHTMDIYAFCEGWTLEEARAVESLAEQGDLRAGILQAAYLESIPSVVPTPEYVERYREAAEAGVPAGMRLWAICLARGYGVKQDRAEAVRWCRKGAELGDVVCIVQLAADYAAGIDGVVEQDDKRAVELMERAASMGSPKARQRLSMSYRDGSHGLPKDEAKWLEYAKLAAASDNPYYASDLAGCYGENDPKQYEQLQKAVELGSPDAAWQLGLAYFPNGFYGEDYERARELFEQAAFEGGDAFGFNMLGRIHSEALGVPDDDNLGIFFFEQARIRGSEFGSKNVDMFLAYAYPSRIARAIEQQDLRGYGELDRLPDMLQYLVLRHAHADRPMFDREAEERTLREELADLERLELLVNPPSAPLKRVRDYLEGRLAERGDAWREAADAGSPIAQYILGVLRTTGLVKDADAAADEAAALYYKQAAKGGLPLAQRRYGRALIKGLGFPIDEPEGARWLATSAANGDILGIHTFAWALENGRGVEKNVDLSLHLLDYAFRHGAVLSAYILGKKHKDGSGVASSYVLARGYYHYATKRGHAASMNNLAVMLMNSEGGGRNYNQGKRLYARAAGLGLAIARQNLQGIEWNEAQEMRRLEEQEQRYLDEYWGGAQTLHDLPR